MSGANQSITVIKTDLHIFNLKLRTKQPTRIVTKCNICSKPISSLSLLKSCRNLNQAKVTLGKSFKKRESGKLKKYKSPFSNLQDNSREIWPASIGNKVKLRYKSLNQYNNTRLFRQAASGRKNLISQALCTACSSLQSKSCRVIATREYISQEINRVGNGTPGNRCGAYPALGYIKGDSKNILTNKVTKSNGKKLGIYHIDCEPSLILRFSDYCHSPETQPVTEESSATPGSSVYKVETEFSQPTYRKKHVTSKIRPTEGRFDKICNLKCTPSVGTKLRRSPSRQYTSKIFSSDKSSSSTVNMKSNSTSIPQVPSIEGSNKERLKKLRCTGRKRVTKEIYGHKKYDKHNNRENIIRGQLIHVARDSISNQPPTEKPYIYQAREINKSKTPWVARHSADIIHHLISLPDNDSRIKSVTPNIFPLKSISQVSETDCHSVIITDNLKDNSKLAYNDGVSAKSVTEFLMDKYQEKHKTDLTFKKPELKLKQVENKTSDIYSQRPSSANLIQYKIGRLSSGNFNSRTSRSHFESTKRGTPKLKKHEKSETDIKECQKNHLLTEKQVFHNILYSYEENHRKVKNSNELQMISSNMQNLSRFRSKRPKTINVNKRSSSKNKQTIVFDKNSRSKIREKADIESRLYKHQSKGNFTVNNPSTSGIIPLPDELSNLKLEPCQKSVKSNESTRSCTTKMDCAISNDQVYDTGKTYTFRKSKKNKQSKYSKETTKVEECDKNTRSKFVDSEKSRFELHLDGYKEQQKLSEKEYYSAPDCNRKSLNRSEKGKKSSYIKNKDSTNITDDMVRFNTQSSISKNNGKSSINIAQSTKLTIPYEISKDKNSSSNNIPKLNTLRSKNKSVCLPDERSLTKKSSEKSRMYQFSNNTKSKYNSRNNSQARTSIENDSFTVLAEYDIKSKKSDHNDSEYSHSKSKYKKTKSTSLCNKDKVRVTARTKSTQSESTTKDYEQRLTEIRFQKIGHNTSCSINKVLSTFKSNPSNYSTETCSSNQSKDKNTNIHNNTSLSQNSKLKTLKTKDPLRFSNEKKINKSTQPQTESTNFDTNTDIVKNISNSGLDLISSVSDTIYNGLQSFFINPPKATDTNRNDKSHRSTLKSDMCSQTTIYMTQMSKSLDCTDFSSSFFIDNIPTNLYSTPSVSANTKSNKFSSTNKAKLRTNIVIPQKITFSQMIDDKPCTVPHDELKNLPGYSLIVDVRKDTCQTCTSQDSGSEIFSHLQSFEPNPSSIARCLNKWK